MNFFNIFWVIRVLCSSFWYFDCMFFGCFSFVHSMTCLLCVFLCSIMNFISLLFSTNCSFFRFFFFRFCISNLGMCYCRFCFCLIYFYFWVSNCAGVTIFLKRFCININFCFRCFCFNSNFSRMISRSCCLFSSFIWCLFGFSSNMFLFFCIM